MIIHLQTHFKKMSKRDGDWGHQTPCGKKFRRGSEKLTTAIQWINCQPCLQHVIAKKERELDYLKWALKDRKQLGELRLPLSHNGTAK